MTIYYDILTTEQYEAMTDDDYAGWLTQWTTESPFRDQTDFNIFYIKLLDSDTSYIKDLDSNTYTIA